MQNSGGTEGHRTWCLLRIKEWQLWLMPHAPHDLSQPFKKYGNETMLSIKSNLPFLCSFFFQEMYKASKYEVSPDMKLVLLAYNVQLVRPVFIWVLYVCVEMKVIMARCERTVTLHRLTRTKIHPAGVTETQQSHTHTHTPASRERGGQRLFSHLVWLVGLNSASIPPSPPSLLILCYTVWLWTTGCLHDCKN